MILKEDLVRIARLNNLRAFQQEKHYIQTLALRSIYASTNDLAFIELDAIYTDILPFFVLVMKREEILAEKVRAVLTRNRAMDVYDLWSLLKKGTGFELNLVNEKLKYYQKVFEKEVFMERIQRTEGYWESELKPLVIGRLPRFDAVYEDVKDLI